MDAATLADLEAAAESDGADDETPTYDVEVTERDLRRAGAALVVLEEAIRDEISATEAEWADMPPAFRMTLLVWRLARLRVELANGGEIDEPGPAEPEDEPNWGYH